MIVKSKFSMLSADGVAAPLRHVTFRRIWLASLLSNLGLFIQGGRRGVGDDRMTSYAGMVALVQTALDASVLLVSIAAGAIADMYDRRMVGSGFAVGLAGGRNRSHRAHGRSTWSVPGPFLRSVRDRHRHGAVWARLAGIGLRAGAGAHAAARRSR